MLSILSIPAPENASAGSPQQSFFYQKVLHLLDNLPWHGEAVTGGFRAGIFLPNSVGADAYIGPPYRTSCKNLSLRGQFANWLWQSASPVPSAPPCLKGTVAAKP